MTNKPSYRAQLNYGPCPRQHIGRNLYPSPNIAQLFHNFWFDHQTRSTPIISHYYNSSKLNIAEKWSVTLVKGSFIGRLCQVRLFHSSKHMWVVLVEGNIYMHEGLKFVWKEDGQNSFHLPPHIQTSRENLHNSLRWPLPPRPCLAAASFVKNRMNMLICTYIYDFNFHSHRPI